MAPEPTRPLFRKQAIQAAGQKAYGEIVLSRTPATMVFAGCAIVFVIGLVVLAVKGEITRISSSSGEVVPTLGLLRISAPLSGTVAKRMLTEGKTVKAGESLFEIATERYLEQRQSVEKAVVDTISARRVGLLRERDATERRVNQQTSALADKIARLNDERLRVGELISLQNARQRLVDETAARFEKLSIEGFVSGAILSEKKQEALDARQRVAEFRRNLAQVEREIAATVAERAALQTQGQRDIELLGRSIYSTDQELIEQESRRATILRAPQEGEVSSILVSSGQQIAAGDLLATITPSPEKLSVDLYVSASNVGFVREGTEVLLRFKAYPYQKYGQLRRRVTTVSSATHTREEWLNGTQKWRDDLTYRVRIDIGEPRQDDSDVLFQLRAGMAVEGLLLLEKRKLYTLIVEPLKSLARS